MTGGIRNHAAAVMVALGGAATAAAIEVVIEPGPTALRAAQAAIDRLESAGGGTVRLPPGRLLLSAALRLGSGVTVAGVPGETVLVIGPGAEQPLTADAPQGATTIRVADATALAVGDGVAIDDADARGFHVSTATIVERLGDGSLRLSAPLVDDYRVERRARVVRAYPGVGGWGIRDAVLEDVVVEGDHDAADSQSLTGCRGGGIYLHDCERVAVRRCVARGYDGDGISFQQCRNVVVDTCLAEWNANVGLHPGLFSTSCTIRDSVARDNGYVGLFVCVGVQRATFENNLLEHNRGCGISIGRFDSDNLFRGNRVVGNAEVAVLFRRDTPDPADGAHRNVFEANEFFDNVGPRPVRSNSRPDSEGLACVVIEGRHEGLVFRDNRFELSALSSRAAILIDADADALTVQGNQTVNVAPLVEQRAVDEAVTAAAARLLVLADRLGPAGRSADFRGKVSRARTVEAVESAAAGLVTLRVHVNPESRVKLQAVRPAGELVVGRPQPLLVEIVNEAGVTAPLTLRVFDLSGGVPRPATFCNVALRDDALSAPRLSGAGREWKLVDLGLTAVGRWEVRLEADVGQGTQDLGFRSTADLLLRGVAAAGEP